MDWVLGLALARLGLWGPLCNERLLPSKVWSGVGGHLMMSSSPLSATADCSRSLGCCGMTSGQVEGSPGLPRSARTTLQQ